MNLTGNKLDKQNKPFYKRWWFIALVVLFAIGLIAGGEEEIKGYDAHKETATGQEVVAEVDKEAEKQKREEAKRKEKEEKERLKQEQALKAKEEYIKSAQEYDYNDIERNPDNYKGKPAVFEGKVIQVSEGVFGTTYRVATEGDYDNVVLVTYKLPEGEPRILEDDIIEIYGDLEGVRTYTSVIGAKITVPAVTARYIIIK